MLVSESWLREWVSTQAGSEALSERLTLAGLEVESVDTAGPDLDRRVIVGEITAVTGHSDASQLRVCTVDTGDHSIHPIVCGAKNIRAGLKTAIALPGAVLPGSNAVTVRTIRGVRSEGMICSREELGLEESSEGILELDESAPLGTAIGDYLDLRDQRFRLELTPNRGDCLGIVGVAREVATLTGGRLAAGATPENRLTSRAALEVVLEAPAGCPRYVGRAIAGIDMSAKTPDWMVERLRRSGMRSINVVVDVTNYVMHELGQPMHGFDFSKIEGGIRVRMAKKGETLTLLDGNTVTLEPENLVIADHQNAIALAGIMGGESTAISSDTRDIYLEAAYFSPTAMLGRARRFGMQTDASHRFERGVDSQLQLQAIEQATALVIRIAGGHAGPISHAVEKSALPKAPRIKFVESEIQRILGIRVPSATTAAILEDLGMKATRTDVGWDVVPPSWRHDIQASHDLVEEVGRCHGFDQILPRAPNTEPQIGAHRENRISLDEIKRAMVYLGFHEAITYSFVEPESQQQLLDRGNAIPLQNPIADNMSVMRQSLWPGLLEALKTNLNRQEERVRLFEAGQVFLRAVESGRCTEIGKLGIILCGNRRPRQWGEEAVKCDFFDLKGCLESIFMLTGQPGKFEFRQSTNPAMHPEQCASIVFGNREIGHLGKLHPVHQRGYDLERAVYLAEFELSPLCSANLPVFSEISKFPSVHRDLSVMVDEGIPVQSVLQQIRATAGPHLRKLELFDIYRGSNVKKNKKSLAFSLTFQSESSNLISLEMEAEIEKIIKVLNEAFGAEMRT